MKLKLSLLLILSLFLVQQNFAQGAKANKKIILNGLVLDAGGNPVSKAAIFVDGNNSNILSDADGRFSIKLKPKTKIITVFTLFHGGIEVAYQGDTELTFHLSTANPPANNPLNDPVQVEDDRVNVGYGTAHKRNLTTSVGEVNKAHLRSTQQYSTIYDMIKGEVPGVVVNGNSIVIRGLSSINLSSEPLYVVNGSPISNIADISPNDVKSISVLKGSSAAIYGARGANGVIVIVLKSAGDN
ncbi:MAG TPA: hypothetical protein DCG69_03415 [Bacteroidales bacterium]|nr:hypothetical protein [Bacteroidales bacterium]